MYEQNVAHSSINVCLTKNQNNRQHVSVRMPSKLPAHLANDAQAKNVQQSHYANILKQKFALNLIFLSFLQYLEIGICFAVENVKRRASFAKIVLQAAECVYGHFS